MYKNCRTKASAERQKQFEQTMLELMEKQLYKEITVSALCKEMGAPRKAFYRYFDSIEERKSIFRCFAKKRVESENDGTLFFYGISQ